MVIPDFEGDQYKAWEWLKQHARNRGQEDLIHQVKEHGDCSLQTVNKVRELAALLGTPINMSQFEGC
jgi:hypothetical protein